MIGCLFEQLSGACPSEVKLSAPSANVYSEGKIKGSGGVKNLI